MVVLPCVRHAAIQTYLVGGQLVETVDTFQTFFFGLLLDAQFVRPTVVAGSCAAAIGVRFKVALVANAKKLWHLTGMGLVRHISAAGQSVEAAHQVTEFLRLEIVEFFGVEVFHIDKYDADSEQSEEEEFHDTTPPNLNYSHSVI